jgi:ethanolamine transporter EutH
MFYAKNVPNWERVVRIVLGLIVIAAVLHFMSGPAAVLIAVSAAGIVASGLIGFCPMCALVGRKLDKRAKTLDGTR